MRKILLLFFVIAGFALTACASEAATPAAESAGEQTADEQAGGEQTITTELTVWGMTCNRCANQVINAVSAAEGVIDVLVDVSADKVTIEHDAELDIDMIKSTIEAEGYNLP